MPQMRAAVVISVVTALAGAGFAGANPMNTATPSIHRPIDQERDCQELVPAAYSAPVLAEDDGTPVDFDVLVFRDGVDIHWAEAIMRNAQTSYEPLAIDVKATFRRIRIPADGSYSGRPAAGSQQLFEALRKAVNGRRPKGFDGVLLLTEKAMFSFTDSDGDGVADENEREYGHIGEAACAGGVRWPETAFALVDAEFSNLAEDVGITTAHELGHLLGGHHHLANCAEGARADPQTPCTVMSAYALAISSRFSSINASIVRGHAVTFAAP